MAAYVHYLRAAATECRVSIHGWVFMTNHVHLLVTPEEDNSLSKVMQNLGRHYFRYFNRRYQRTGTLFEGRFRSCLVEQGRYFLICQRYIELNPVRAGRVKDPADYVWSSYRSNAFGRSVKLWEPDEEYLSLASGELERQARYRALFNGQIGTEVLADLRQSINQALAFGSGTFRVERV